MLSTGPREEATMGYLRTGDDELHYVDSSHRWIAPPDIAQDNWEVRVRAHLDQHLLTMGRPVSVDYLRNHWSPHSPHPRVAPKRAAQRTDARSGRG
jgi:hypothetical protein